MDEQPNDEEKERLCPQAKTLGNICSCSKKNNCGYTFGEACFFPTANCLPPCELFAKAKRICACSMLTDVGIDASIVHPNEMCGNSATDECSAGCFQCFKGKCQICLDRHARSGGECIKCPSNCWKCKVKKDELECQQCMFGFRLVDGECVCPEGYIPGTSECLIDQGEEDAPCYKSQYYDRNKARCMPCHVSGCAICDSNPDKCDICFTGVRNTTECPSCDGKCSCLSTNLSFALNCANCDALNRFDGGCKECASGYLMTEVENCITKGSTNAEQLPIWIIALSSIIGVVAIMATGIVLATVFYRKRKTRLLSAQKFKGWFNQKSVLAAVTG